VTTLLTEKSVVVVDPKEENRKQVSDVLTPLGAYVVEATDSKGFFQVFTSHRPDIVLLGLDLPTMKGVDVIGWLKDMFGDDGLPPVIMLVPAGREGEIEAAVKAGAVGGAKIPVVSEELIKTVKSCL